MYKKNNNLTKLCIDITQPFCNLAKKKRKIVYYNDQCVTVKTFKYGC